MRRTVVWFLWWRSRIFVYRKASSSHPLRHISLFERCSHSKSGNSTARTFFVRDGKPFFRQYHSEHERILTEVRMEPTYFYARLEGQARSERPDHGRRDACARTLPRSPPSRCVEHPPREN